MKRNIVFSTTRQWNPGDEIILKGIINLLRDLKIEFNPLIFNRNPDIRSSYGIPLYRNVAKHENELWYNIKSAIMDNSIKPWSQYANIDAIIFAGTPEWQGGRSRELYINAVKYQIPVYFIGIDSNYSEKGCIVESVVKKAKFISVRNRTIKKSFDDEGIKANYIPCPSILASNTEKIIDNVYCIGLIYRGFENDVTVWNGWDKEHYQSQIKVYNKIISEYKEHYKIIIICHYIDELYLAERDFPGLDIRYSYDSADYMEIYGECDLVIGSRIHGIGIATSMGIPSIPIKYDVRQGTMDGFYPNNLYFGDLYKEDIFQSCLSNIRDMNRMLIAHKHQVRKAYQNKLKNKMDFNKVKYDYNLIQIKEKYFIQNNKKLSELDIDIHNHMVEKFTKIVLSFINDMIKGKKVIIKGGGFYAKKLLKYLDDSVTIIGIADNNLNSFEGYNVFRNDKLYQMDFDYIIISSYRFEREMLEEMKQLGLLYKTISLYRIYEDNFGAIDQRFFCFANNT